MDELTVFLATTHPEYISISLDLESDSRYLYDCIGLRGESCGLEIECDEDHNGDIFYVIIVSYEKKKRIQFLSDFYKKLPIFWEFFYF